jgi:hypothetical protein
MESSFVRQDHSNGSPSSPLFARSERILMAASGELIRMMNYVDDIAATLRRINGSLFLLSDEEKKRLAEYMRASDPSVVTVVQQLEQGAEVHG